MKSLVSATFLLYLSFSLAVFGQRGQMGKDTAPKKGDKAPDFKLILLEKEQKDGADRTKTDDKEKKPVYVKLSDCKEKKDVVLIFGSYT